MLNNQKIAIKLKSCTKLNLNDITEYLNKFIKLNLFGQSLNTKYGLQKKIRMSNFPSEISEIIVKYIIESIYNRPINWMTKSGDLSDNNQKLEVKCFSSTGPSSFGPTECWHKLYFLDATDYMNYNFKCYEINLSNVEFGFVKVSLNQTYFEQCQEKRRPRLCFSQLKAQLNETQLKCIFDGHLDQLKQVLTI